MNGDVPITSPLVKEHSQLYLEAGQVACDVAFEATSDRTYVAHKVHLLQNMHQVERNGKLETEVNI
eukprot:Pgem_evm1s14532